MGLNCFRSISNGKKQKSRKNNIVIINLNNLRTMMFKNLCLCALLAALAPSSMAYASVEGVEAVQQNKRVVGTIIDETGEPVIGANVIVKGTTNGVITDMDGHFELTNVPANGTIVISFMGYTTQEISVKGKNQIDVTLKEDSNLLEEVVAVGYQTQRKADLTGSVSVVKMNDVKDIPTSNPMESLQGRLPGVSISTSGNPGGDASIQIRGIGTLGNTDPLYVIDGMPTKRGLNELNPKDIESIQVLKDASSASIYGSRAANGVIIITTKRAQEGYSKIEFNASLSTQAYVNRLEPLNLKELGEVTWRSNVNDGLDPNTAQTLYKYQWNGDYSNPQLTGFTTPDFLDEAQTMRVSDTDWYDEISRTPLIQSYNLTFSNGSKKGRSMISLAYYDNKGIVKETFMNRYTARANSDYNFFNERLKVGENLSFTYTSKDKQSVAGMSNSVLAHAMRLHPAVPVHTVDGGWGGPWGKMSDVTNPVRMLEDNAQNKDNFMRIFGNAFAEVKIMDGLTAKTSFGIDYSGTYYRTLRKSFVSGFLKDDTNEANVSFSMNGNWTWQNTLQYNKTFGKHRLTALLGHEMMHYSNQQFNALRQGYALETIDYAYMNAGTSAINNGGSGSSYSLLSYFGKLDYQFNNRYLFSFTLRRDGSSRFAKESRWGTFPALSFGWRASEEEFIKKLGIFSDLKFRYGWGQNGNQEIANYAYLGIYQAIYSTQSTSAWWPYIGESSGTAYDITGNGGMVSGFVRTQQDNLKLKWETTNQHNAGIDFGFFDQKLTGSIDYFIKDTKDILISPSYLAVVGEGGNRYANGASMKNKGIEFQIAYNTQLNKDTRINIGANISHYDNEVTYLPEEVLTSYAGNGTTDVILGRSIRSQYGYVADGLFQNQAEVDAHAKQPGAAPGRIRFKDLNGDKVIDDKDRKYISTGLPKFDYGFNFGITYKDLSLSMFWQGVYGLDVYNSQKRFTDFTSMEAGVNYGKRVLDAWTPQNSSSTIPALTTADNNNEARTNTYFLENGSFLKLRNIQVTYNLDKLIKKTSFISHADIFLQASNLLTIHAGSFTGADPENASNAYPRPLVTTIGVNVSF